MQPGYRKAIASQVSRSSQHEKVTGFFEIAIFSLLGLALTLILIAHDLFPALPPSLAQ
jgi:hypothetical protein